MSSTNGQGLLADLQWRGLIAQTTDLKALEEAMAKPITLYLGVDPTAPSMHLGNLVVCLVLRRFQLAGHKPIPLVGGATGLVGDPSGRNEERSLNDESIVADWVSRIRKQLEMIIDFDDKKSGAVLANNLDWTKPVSALEFLRDIGKHFSVNQMLAKDSVASRLDAGGISYTEFSYQVLQAFDYLELFRRNNCTLQIGGSDQWGNIVAGLDLIRKVEGGTAHALTVPLLTKSDGSKFGKTASGAIWLDPQMTSPYEFFQFWLNCDDADIPKLLKVFSMKEHSEIEALIDMVQKNPGATLVCMGRRCAERLKHAPTLDRSPLHRFLERQSQPTLLCLAEHRLSIRSRKRYTAHHLRLRSPRRPRWHWPRSNRSDRTPSKPGR
jgi:tyrosyl-tRNA synthetase